MLDRLVISKYIHFTNLLSHPSIYSVCHWLYIVFIRTSSISTEKHIYKKKHLVISPRFLSPQMCPTFNKTLFL
jgi:hypothetical protein